MKTAGLCTLLAFLSMAMSLITSCTREEPDDGDPEIQSGKIVFTFRHLEHGKDLVTDTLAYMNAAGNRYLVTEIQYFISDVVLHRDDGVRQILNEWKDIHYVDTDIPSTHSWQVFDQIAQGAYDSISFTFGINESKNISMMFVNPPEANMFWPEYLGGGYHYLKLNGKWLGPDELLNPFEFHLGIGQYYDNEGNITGFVHNHFNVTLQASSFEVAPGDTLVIPIEMNIESWFETPNVYDFNYWGGGIMQNQEAMQDVKENGMDVFTIGDVHKRGAGK